MGVELEHQKLLQLFVAGRPYAQSRARHVNGNVYSNASKGLKEWKERLRVSIRAASSELELKQLDGALFVDLVFFMPVKDKARHGQLCYTKPDKDNLEKAVLDVMEGARMFFKGDSQVAAGEVVKVWCPYGQEGVFISMGRVRAKESPQRDAEGDCDGVDWLA